MATPDYGSIQLDDTRFKLAGDPSVTAVDRFPGKITIGDYSLDSNDLLSTWLIRDLSGGHGIAEHVEGTTDNRFRWSNLNTRYPGQWAPPFKRYGETVANSYVYPLGDMTISGTTTRFAVAGVHRLYSDVPSGTTTNWTDRGAITGVPTDKGVAFCGLAAIAMFYVPQGANGYSVYDTSGPTLRNTTGGETMVSFCLWDNKLIGIDTTGQLYYATTATAAGATTFTSYGATAKLDPSRTPRHLVLYYNRVGEPAIYVITDQDTWVFDAATPALYLVPDMGSPNPDFGRAACVWRGLLYVSSGMDVYEFNGSVRRNIGLSRDDGPSDKHSLPYSYLGTIVDLVPAQNGLYAYVKGAVASGSNYNSSVHEYSGYGWATTWLSAKSYTGPSWAAVSRAGGGYFLWWGDLSQNSTFANTGFMPLPTNDTNPAEALASGAYAFGVGGTGVPDDTYTLETGWFDGGMPNYVKVASSLKISIDPAGAGIGGSGIDSFAVFYRTDDATSYTSLGLWTFDANGLSTKVLGATDAYGVAGGFLFKKIEFKIAYAYDTSATATPLLVKYMAFAFRKVQNPSLSWTFPIDLSAPFNNLSPQQMRTKLTTLRTQGTFCALQHQATTYRVAVSGFSEQTEAGKDLRGHAMVSVIEIPQEPGQGVTALS